MSGEIFMAENYSVVQRCTLGNYLFRQFSSLLSQVREVGHTQQSVNVSAHCRRE